MIAWPAVPETSQLLVSTDQHLAHDVKCLQMLDRMLGMEGSYPGQAVAKLLPWTGVLVSQKLVDRP
jgi:hypothetical protein